VILGVRPSEFILSEFQSPSRRIFIGSHSLPPLWSPNRSFSFPIIKIPSVFLVAVMWLQRTRCPRFRRDTIGYGTTTSPKREIGYEYGVFMRMHVSIPKLPKCICYATHTQKVTFILIHKVVSKTKKIKFRIEESIGSALARTF
jgi:hypothetical protein